MDSGNDPLLRRKREHFGSGLLSLEYSTSLFINCPFDSEFQPVMDSFLFGAVCCGFTPRSALETGSVAEVRINRIMNAICESKYSVHDLSRCTGQGAANLARFNMPLELGIAMARRHHTISTSECHDWLVTVPNNHMYGQFISNLGGFDPSRYDGSPRGAVAALVSWLATRSDAVLTMTPRQVLSLLPLFEAELAELRAEWAGSPPWADLVRTARKIETRFRQENP